jgi:hypothetical protein
VQAAERPATPHPGGPPPGSPERSIVPPPEEAHALPFEHGLVRSVVLGGVIGFAIVFVLVATGLLLIDMELAYVLPSAGFVAAFGGIGFGGMQSAALHTPRSR